MDLGPWTEVANKGFACVQLLGCVLLSATQWTIAYQAPLSMEFFRQEYWSGLPFPPPGGSSQPRDGTRISCVSCITGGFFTRWTLRKPLGREDCAFVTTPEETISEVEKDILFLGWEGKFCAFNLHRSFPRDQSSQTRGGLMHAILGDPLV